MKNSSPQSRQRGFFSIGVGLGLSAIFALFGATLAPEHENSQVSSQMEVQSMTVNSEGLLAHAKIYPGKHQF